MSSAQPFVVVSARAPFVSLAPRDGSRAEVARAPGGVVSALLPLLDRTRGVWFATGAADEAIAQGDGGFQVRPVRLDASVRSAWYAGASNAALWPLAHGFLDRCRFRTADFRAYVEVNRQVAEAVARDTAPGTTVWIHDYQLALVPRLLRELRSDLSIGLFWHVPWPGAELLRALPWAGALLDGMLGADVIGFHVPRYVRAFCDALDAAGVEVRGGPAELFVPVGRHRARVFACPIGVDAARWGELGRDPTVRTEAAALRAALGGERVLLAVDRLDYSKGVLERLEAFERVLAREPSVARSTTLVQIGVPSREQVDGYRALRERVESAVGRINGRFGSIGRTPVQLFTRCLPARELAPYYVAADVAVITPLRDGMNLVAFEYVASRSDSSGRLLLSTMAGAAEVLREAQLVNPYDDEALENALEVAATSPETPADAARMTTLKARVAAGTVNAWVDRFLEALAGRRDEPLARTG